LEELRRSLMSMLAKSDRVTSQDLINWAKSNHVGMVMLSILIRDVIKEKSLVTAGEVMLGKLRLSSELKLTIPSTIEVNQRRMMRRERKVSVRRGMSILDTISQDVVMEKNESVGEGLGEGHQPEPPKEEPGTDLRVNHEVSTGEREPGMDLLSKLRSTLREEFADPNEAFNVALAVLNYIARYWSVGELRLKNDLLKQLSGQVKGDLMDTLDRVLRIFARMGIVEFAEPGVINRIADLPKDFTKLRLDFMLT